MRTFAIAAIMIALLPASAFAQEGGPRTSRTDEQKRADTDADRAYQNVIRNTGADKGRSAPAQDPWGKVRPSGASSERR